MSAMHLAITVVVKVDHTYTSLMRNSFVQRIFILPITLFAFVLSLVFAPLQVVAQNQADVWWPTNGAHVSGLQPFKAMVQGIPVEQYDMYWQVDNGQLNWMSNNYTDYPHKEASVELSGWNWKGSGPYQVTFVAKQGDTTIASQTVSIVVGSGPGITTVTQPEITVSSSPIEAPAQTALQAPVAQAPALNGLWVNPNSSAAAQANAWRTSRPADASAMDKLAAQPTAQWFGNWNSNISNDVRAVTSAAQSAGATSVLVAYNIPNRDCGGYSGGGSNSGDAYLSWMRSFASGITGSATVILEPDALANMTCLSHGEQQARMSLLSSAIDILKGAGAKVYLDAGHPGWVDTETMASRLQQAGLGKADGFALNVSNFIATSDNVTYGTSISQKAGGKHFVIDTSRNGLGPTSDYQWCNPSGRGSGIKPTTSTGNGLVDAYFWIKTPGESDGNCNGGPNAGVWWGDYALSLIQRGQ